MTKRGRVATGLVAATVCAVALAGCGGSNSKKSSSSPAGPAGGSSSAVSPSSSQPSSPAPGSGKYYVSVGDSYAAGYQPTAKGKGHTTRNGYAYQVVTDAKAKGYDLTLANFGCAGATTESVLRTARCPAGGLGPGATPYTGTQAAAAERFLRAHRGDIGLVTVSLGGNDFTACAVAANPVTCVGTAVAKIKTNLATLLTGLRSAAGSTATFVGITYPDVLLGDELSKDANRKSVAGLSVTAFQALINPALKATYQAANAKFADVTTATGAYGSLSQTTTLAPYGKIPTPVAKICTLTYYCQYGDIHPRTNGYTVIAKLIVGLLPQR